MRSAGKKFATAGSWLSPEDRRVLAAELTTAHRVYNGLGCWIERFGDDYLISATAEKAFSGLQEELNQWCAAAALPVRRVYGKILADDESGRNAPVLLSGDAALSPQTVVSEWGVRYGLDFSASYSAGLFIDQRGNRGRWRQQPPARLLNCFAYTSSFSVVTALKGAETVSVDLSKKSLDRARANFTLNAINTTTDPRRHRFIADDVFGVIPYLKRKGERFDGIVLDPPTFSRGTKLKTFRVERDFAALLALALDVAAPGARLLLSTNYHRWHRHDLESLAREELARRNEKGRFIDGSVLPDIPAESMPTTLWLALMP